MRRRTVLLAVTWVAGTALAIAVAWQAVGLVSNQVTSGRPQSLSRDQVAAQIAATTTLPPIAVTTSPTSAPPPTVPPTTATPTSPSTSPTAPPVSTKTFAMQGGTVAVQCAGSAISLVYATPAAGSAQEIEKTGPDEVEVRFENDSHKSRLNAECVNGVPVGDIREEAS